MLYGAIVFGFQLCLINLQSLVNLRKGFEIGSEEVDVVSDVGGSGSLSDRVHR